jgi:sulfatase maturation enzyme AslB (radical SAM superfamily)
MRLTTIIYIVIINIKIWILKFLRLDKYIIPYKTLINLTDLCNSKCSFCNIWEKKDENDTISLNNLSLYFKNIGKHLVWLALSGGEITLLDNLTDIVLAAKKNCKNLKVVTFTTNGLNPKRALSFAKFLQINNFDPIVSISLDGNEELHDELRGVKGNYKKCIELYNMLKNEKISVHFGLTVGESNFNFIKDEYSIRKHDIKAITFIHSGGIYNKKNDVNYSIIKEALVTIYNNYSIDHISELIEKIHIKIAIEFINKKMSTNIVPCEVLNTSIHIMQDGNILPCMYLNKIGNLKNDNIIDLMKSKEIKDIKQKIRKNNCPHCWMNCYSPYSIMQHPFKSIKILLKNLK